MARRSRFECHNIVPDESVWAQWDQRDWSVTPLSQMSLSLAQQGVNGRWVQ